MAAPARAWEQQQPEEASDPAAAVRPGARRHRALAPLHRVGPRAADRLPVEHPPAALLMVGLPRERLAAMAPPLANVARPAAGLALLPGGAHRDRRSAAYVPGALRLAAGPAASDVRVALPVPAAERPGAAAGRPAVARTDARGERPRVEAAEPDVAVAAQLEAAGPRAVAEPEAVEQGAVLQQEAAAAEPGAVPRRAAEVRGEAQHPAGDRPNRDAHPAADHVAAVSACRPGRLRPGAPGRRPAARSVRARRPLSASLTARSSQAAGDEVCSCDLGSPEKDVCLKSVDEQICVRPECGVA